MARIKNMKNAKKIENPGVLLKRLMGYIMKHYGAAFVTVLICILISVICNVQGTMFMQTLIDDYIVPMLKDGSRDFSGLAHAITRVAGFYAIGVAVTLLYSQIMVNITQGTLRSLRDDLFTHMQDLPIKYFDTHAHGDIMSVYTNDIDTLRQMISQSIPQIFNSGIMVVSIIVCMLVLSVPLTVVSLAMVGIMVYLSKRIATLSGKYFVQQQKDLANGYIEEMMQGQKVVKVFCHEEKSIEEFKELNDKLFHSADNANKFANIAMPVNAQVGNISYVIVAIVGGILAINGIGRFTLGGLASFLTFNKSLNMPIGQVSQQVNFVAMALAGAQRIFELLDEEPEVDEGYVTLVNATEDADGTIHETDKHTGTWAWKHFHKEDGTTTYAKLLGDVEFLGVDFGYDEKKIVLHDIKMFATPGQKIAFVGSTGAGKTTITNLINRFYDIQDGKIRYDGININKIKKADLRHSLGMVLQDTHLFTASVKDNIRYGKLDASEEEIQGAARAAYAHHFIETQPGGYDMEINEESNNISQGQKQLLTIARAILADPKILILDEATSSVDTRTEERIQMAMDNLMQGRTSFVIAHRLSTIKDADVILVMNHGDIVEQGNHEELLAKGGFYADLYNSQFENA